MATPAADEPRYGSSPWVCDYITEHQIKQIQPSSVVDFGAGAGKYGHMLRRLRGSACHVTAVEGYGPTVAMLQNTVGLYDTVYDGVIQGWLETPRSVSDLAIFGDVLEHLPAREIHASLHAALAIFRYVIVVVPLHDVFQDDAYGNPLEIHRAYITSGFFRRYNPVEQHIAPAEGYRVMNVLIASPTLNDLPVWRYRWAHPALVVLERLGLARAAVAAAKRVRGWRSSSRAETGKR